MHQIFLSGASQSMRACSMQQAQVGASQST
ncbi:hypothetical protein N599_00885 [Saccharopolyspora erythraea D]|nr:hypothetical protein N599_00885 [Saccharopolyspora erythraea D]